MTLTGVLAQGRAAFIRRMRASCLITVAGPIVTLPDGSTEPSSTTVYEGPCYTRYPGLAFEQTPDVAGVTLTVSRVVVRIPHGTVVPVGAVVTIVADPDNPQMAGTKLRVASVDDQSQATAQRLLCEDFQGAGGL